VVEIENKDDCGKCDCEDMRDGQNRMWLIERVDIESHAHKGLLVEPKDED